ncbi:lysin A, glycosyl hydrolase domain [Rhodococcus phage Whack]|uniref:Lysin A, glycosyl hydrolase domain n=1 Tax=Rhodococcus phage Whack TaxID=2591132 RepID=A0A515MKD7_9CAUD|nr:lysin A, glycosyl hydrolase domain [Rhodococcus phage Whack]QDM57084.1 lysin A, glycosyl hydrolase domain [Rhodococcus phage Whack]
MDVQTLAKVMDYRVPMARYEELCPTFNEAMILADCTTERRATMWCAQLGHESGGLLYMQEIADGSAYEWRQDLGNNQPGDGRRFKGRGPIQVTGRGNYTRLSRWAHDRGYVPTPTFFVDTPDELANPRYGFLGAVWYWTVERNMNKFADQDDLRGATFAVNGGLTHIEDRRAYWHRAGDVGAAILPTPPQSGGSPVDIPALVNDQLSGPAGRGWPILGPSKVDPSRDNTVVEALAEIRDGLTATYESFVEPEFLGGNPPARLDLPTAVRFADYQAFHAGRKAEESIRATRELVTKVNNLDAKLDRVLAALGGAK